MSEQNKPSENGKYLDESTWEALKAMGYSEEELYADQPTGPIIFSYSRKQAIADGVLVDLSRPGFEKIVKLAGIVIPAAMTATAFAEVVARELKPDNLWESLCRLGRVVSEVVRQVKRHGQDTDRVFFTVPGVDEQPVKLWALVGPGDSREPVMTIMLEGED